MKLLPVNYVVISIKKLMKLNPKLRYILFCLTGPHFGNYKFLFNYFAHIKDPFNW